MGPSARAIIELNIRHYRLLLSRDMDQTTRQTVAKLLAEEEAKLATLAASDPEHPVGTKSL